MIEHGRAARRGESVRACATARPDPRMDPAGPELTAMLWRFMEQAINGQELSRQAMELQVLSCLAFPAPPRAGGGLCSDSAGE